MGIFVLGLLFYEQYLKKDECNCIKHDFHKTPNMYPNLNANISNEQQFRLISQNISKYIAFLDYFDKSLNVLSILPGSISIASFATVIGAPTGIIGTSCSFTFSITSGFVKRFLKTIKRKRKNTIIFLCWLEVN